MNADYLMTIGLVLGLFSIPAMLSSYAEARVPRGSMAAFILAGALIVFAYSQNPQRYAVAQLPNVVVTVIADIIK